MTAPPVLLPYQQAWLADESQVKVYEKSRRIGISWAEAGDAALHAAKTSGSDVFYVGYDKDMARQFIDDAAFWARHYQLAASELEEAVFRDGDDEGARDIQTFRIRFDSGHEIVALSSAPRGFRSKQGRAVLDEAAFHGDLPALLKSAMAFLMWGGSVRIVSTHNGDDSPFNEMVQDVRAGKKPFSLHRTTFDEALAEGLYERICLRLGKDWSPAAEAEWRQGILTQYGDDADEELHCIPKAGGGAYLSRQLIEARMVADYPVLRLAFDDAFMRAPQHLREAEVRDWCERELAPLLERLDPKRAHSFGEDFGRSVDLTVIAPIEERLDLSRHVPFLLELRNVPFEQQKQVLFYLCDRLPRFMHGAMDARGNGQYLAEVAQQRYGEKIEPVMLSVEWYREQMPAFRAAFQDATIALPKDAEVMDDLRAIRMEKGIAKVPDTARTRDAKGGQRHGDAAIALALGHYASRQESISYEYHRVTRDAAPDDDPPERRVRTGNAGFGLQRGVW
jgi:phage FluMu gp28-like protein